MTEEIIDREQLLAAFNELGVEEVDEAVSFDIQNYKSFYWGGGTVSCT